MPIELACSGCGKRFRVADEHAGKRVKCPSCATVFRVPDAESESADAAPSAGKSPYSPRPLPRDSSAPGADASAGVAASPYQPSPYAAAAPQPAGEELTDSERSMGTMSVVLGIIALVGDFILPFFMLCCCGLLVVVIPVAMMVPSGIGLALAFMSKGSLKTTGLVINSIAIVVGVLALIGLIVLIVVYGGVMALQMQQPNQGGGF